MFANITLRKDCLNDIGSPRTLKMMPIFVQSQDYRFTGTKFREHVRSSKALTTRSAKYLKSAPPFQRRNLENFPIPHNRREFMKLANGQRNGKKVEEDRISQARAYSASLCRYSKQMFDLTVRSSCIHAFNDDNRTNRVKTNRMAGLVNSPNVFQGSSGPTRDGSVLYNEKQKVMNAIRIKTPSEQHSSNCSNERLSCRLSLQETINNKIRIFRILSFSHDSPTSSTNKKTSVGDTDVLFVPLDNTRDSSFLSSDNTDQRKGIVDTPCSEYQELGSTDTRDPFEDHGVHGSFMDGDLTKRNFAKAHGFQSIDISSRALLPPNTTCNLRLASLDETSSSSSDEERGPSTEINKSEPSSPKNHSMKCKPQLPEPEFKPVPVRPKLMLKGPHCWVDDTTISSVHSEHEYDATFNVPESTVMQKTVEFAPAILNISPKGNKITLLYDHTSLEMRTEMNCAQTTNQQALTSSSDRILGFVPTENDPQSVNYCSNGEMTTQGNLKENSKSECILPTFICPSSEKKSREAALRHWLANTCFMTGTRGVPLL